MKFSAVGDAIIQRRIPFGFAGYGELNPFIMQGDARFFNLETTINREGECPASQFSGGTYLRATPDVLDDLLAFGFNMTSANNNHTLDFSYEGLYRTIDALDEHGLIHAGIGKNLGEASAPRYLDTSSGRVALISVNTSFEPSMMAGRQTERIKGRAGINGIGLSQALTLDKSDFDTVLSLSQRLGINIENEVSRREGYLPDIREDQAELGDLKFSLGSRTHRELIPCEKDILRVERSIFEARLAADHVIISLHSHEMDSGHKHDAPCFLSALSHRLIDAGADAIIGHGPHLIRPIEVYRQRPIFYSLGNFICELYSIELAPDEFFARYSLDAGRDTVHDLLKRRSHNFTCGLMEDRRMMESVIALWESDDDGSLRSLSLMPIELCMHGRKSKVGLPRRAERLDFIERLAAISSPYGVEMAIDNDGIVRCKW